MLVKKINPEWQPSENPGLKVGEKIEITDAKSLILGGMAVAVGAHGEDVSAYELYGVIAENDLDGFEEFLQEKKARAVKAKLEADAKVLEATLKEVDAQQAPAEPVAAEPAPAPAETKKTTKK